MQVAEGKGALVQGQESGSCRSLSCLSLGRRSWVPVAFVCCLAANLYTLRMSISLIYGPPPSSASAWPRGGVSFDRIVGPYRYKFDNDTMAAAVGAAIWRTTADAVATASTRAGRARRTLGRRTVSYRVIRDLEYRDSLNPYRYHTCSREGRSPLHPDLAAPGVLDFNTQISTNVRVLLMGDSVGMQMSLALEEAVGAVFGGGGRHVVRYSWGKGPSAHEGITLSHPIRGGGAVAGWRITGMFSRRGRNRWNSMPNKVGGGWIAYDAEELRGRLRRDNASSAALAAPADAEDPGLFDDDRFDVVVHQFPGGWMSASTPWIERFTPRAVGEAVQLSHDVFGAETVVLQTVVISNNVHDVTGVLVPVNRAIREFARSYVPPPDGTGVRRVLVLDAASLTLSLMLENAMSIGLVERRNGTGATDDIVEAYSDDLDRLMRHRLSCCSGHPIPIALGCAEAVPANSSGCVRNYVSVDGMHWCMPTLAGRMNAGLACLLRCAYHDDERIETGDIHSGESVNGNGSGVRGGRDTERDCEAQCNSRYMSLEPVAWSSGTEGNAGVLYNYS